MNTSVAVVSLVALLCCCLPAASSVADAAGTTTTTTNKGSQDTCLYIISVQTGTVADAGTDARISVTFLSADGADPLYVDNLESWTHDNPNPFESGYLDRFRHYNKCRDDLCYMLLESDGSGDKPGWYVDYVRLLAVRNGSADSYSLRAAGHMFPVYQWLALDEPPYKLYAEEDLCSGKGAAIM